RRPTPPLHTARSDRVRGRLRLSQDDTKEECCEGQKSRNSAINASGLSHGTRWPASSTIATRALGASDAARFASATYFVSRAPAIQSVGIVSSCSREATGGREPDDH